MVTSIQTPPKRIYGEGNNATTFQFVMAYGNNVMFECVEPTNFTLQVYGPSLQPNRPYHLYGSFEGNSFGNIIRFLVDGVPQTLAEPSNRQPNNASLNIRSVGQFADPSGTVGIGGDVVLLNAPVNGHYQHWNAFDGAASVLTDSQVRQELFEKGALPDVTITSGSQASMQTQLDALANTVRDDAPLCILVEQVTGDGDLELVADNITFDERASLHVLYEGTGTLTWRNTNGSSASIGSTINGGTLVFATDQTLTVTVKDVSTGLPIEGARVYLEAATGGSLPTGQQIMSVLTDASGVATQSFDYTVDQPISGRVRKSSSPIYYKEGAIGGQLTSTPLNEEVLMVPD